MVRVWEDQYLNLALSISRINTFKCYIILQNCISEYSSFIIRGGQRRLSIDLESR